MIGVHDPLLVSDGPAILEQDEDEDGDEGDDVDAVDVDDVDQSQN